VKVPTQQQSMTVVVQSEATRKTDCPIRREIPGDDWGEVMRRVVQAGTLRVAQASVHFHSGYKILWAEIAAVRRSSQREWTTGANGVGELPGLARQQVLGNNGIHSDIPSFECAGKQKLHFQFVVMLLSHTALETA